MSEIVFNAPPPPSDLQSQVENLQTTLASLNQQVIILQESLQERDEKIKDLEMRLSECLLTSQTMPESTMVEKSPRIDNTLTILGVLINLYRFFFPPGKAA